MRSTELLILSARWSPSIGATPCTVARLARMARMDNSGAYNASAGGANGDSGVARMERFPTRYRENSYDRRADFRWCRISVLGRLSGRDRDALGPRPAKIAPARFVRGRRLTQSGGGPRKAGRFTLPLRSRHVPGHDVVAPGGALSAKTRYPEFRLPSRRAISRENRAPESGF